MKLQGKSVAKAIAIILFLPPLLILLVIIVRASVKPVLDDVSRAEGVGQYIELTDGVTHYEFNEVDSSAPLVVMIHGVTVPMVVWNKTVPALNNAGVSTVRMDLLGRGYSDRPKKKYEAELYVKQIRELLDSLNITRPVHILGVSMGGAIAAHFATAFPKQVASVTLIDPAVSYRHEDGGAYVWNRLRKGVTALRSMKRNGKKAVKMSHSDFSSHIKKQFKYRGIEFTLLSMALYGDSEDFIYAYRDLAKLNIPLQIIWGDNDKILPLDLGIRLSREFDSVPLHIIAEGGHTPHYAKPSKVNPIIITFVQSL